ncbi:uncharacterized protein ACN2A1_000733 [Glossina fuscipes fuscipes]
MWDDWEEDNGDYCSYGYQRRLSDPSANLNNFSRYAWPTKSGGDAIGSAGVKARSENEGLDSLASEVSEIEAGDLRDAAPVEEINRKDDEQCLDNNNATDSTTDLTHSDTRLLEIQNNLESRINNMNVQNSQQHIVMEFSNINKLHIGSVYNVHNENNANNKRKNVPADHIYDRNRKTTTIVAMMQSQEEPSHRIIDTIATRLVEGWKMVMRELGFSDGQIS